MNWLAVPFALLIASTGNLTADERQEDVKTAAVEMILPRFSGRSGDMMMNPDLRKALKGVPTLAFSGPLFPFSFRTEKGVFGGLTIRIGFEPSKTDVGYVAKAVATVLPETKREKQPPAILMIRTDSRNGLNNDQRKSLWKELSKVEGVNVDASCQLKEGNIVGIVLDETGKAKLKTILEAVETTGTKVLKP